MATEETNPKINPYIPESEEEIDSGDDALEEFGNEMFPFSKDKDPNPFVKDYEEL